MLRTDGGARVDNDTKKWCPHDGILREKSANFHCDCSLNRGHALRLLGAYWDCLSVELYAMKGRAHVYITNLLVGLPAVFAPPVPGKKSIFLFRGFVRFSSFFFRFICSCYDISEVLSFVCSFVFQKTSSPHKHEHHDGQTL